MDSVSLSEQARVSSGAPPPRHGPPADSVIHTSGLTRRFNGDIAVRDVSLEVPRGTIFGFIGPSGSGKTTTLRMLTGLVRPTDGEIRVLGKRPAELAKRQQVAGSRD